MRRETPKETPRQSVRRLGFSGRAIRWVYLLTVSGLALVLAAAAELVPATAISDHGIFGVGTLAGFNAVVSLLSLAAALLGGLRSVIRRWPPLIVLLAFNVIACALFPPRWLLACLRTDEILFYFEEADGEFALTIDDGVDPATTPRILEVLARHKSRATFFVLGETLQANDRLARRIVAEGHELANHQWTESPAIALPPEQLESEMERANDAISSFMTPRWFRPGGGVVPNSALPTASDLNIKIALGSVFPFDSHIPWYPFLSTYVEGRTQSGSIVVLHDAGDRGERTAAVLDRVLPRLGRQGLRAVTLSELAR